MYERMLDKRKKPALEEMIACCGARAALFSDFLSGLERLPDVQREVRFPYGNHYGWSVTYRRKKRLLCDVFPEAEAFSVMLRLSGAQLAAVYDQVLPYTQDCIDHKYPCGDGGWLHYRVLRPEHLQDALTLVRNKLGAAECRR